MAREIGYVSLEPTIGIIGAGASVGRALAPFLIDRDPHRVRLFNRTGGAIKGRAFEALPTLARDLAKVDTVVHLAGLVNASDDGEYQAANVDLAGTMARLAREAEASHFVLLSSLSVHGHWSDAPCAPDSPITPAGAYAASKAAAEDEVRRCLEGSGTRLTILRPPMVYGPGARSKFGAFVRAARLGLPLPIGCANARRSMISLANLTDAMVHVSTSRPLGREPVVLLPADDRDLQTREVYSVLCQLAGKSPWLPPVPPAAIGGAMRLLGRGPIYDSLFRPSVIDRAHWAGLGWTPPQTIEEGLRAAVA